MKIDLHFLVYCETDEWWWQDYFAVPRVGETVEYYDTEYMVKEVKYTHTWVNITVVRI